MKKKLTDNENALEFYTLRDFKKYEIVESDLKVIIKPTNTITANKITFEPDLSLNNETFNTYLTSLEYSNS